jgi:cell division protein FtsZ
MVITEVRPDFIPGAKIKVIGVGGAWNKAINRMVSEWLEWVEFIAVNTDAQDLATNLASRKINIGLNITKGLGAWAEPEVGRKAAEETADEIKAMLHDTDMVFVTYGLGGGTGTGAAPVVAEIAKNMGILTVAIVTKPFSFEWKKRDANAEEGMRRIKDVVDTLIVIPNDKIFTIVDKKTTFKQAFTMIDKILFLGVQGISDLLIKPGDINIDFADISKVMRDSGNALLGIWYGAWEKRAADAARKAIENPLLETNLDGAKSIIFAVAGWLDLTPIEVQEAAAIIEEIADPDANIIWGMTFDESYEDEVKVTIIATWFDEQSTESVIKKPARDILGRKVAPTRSSQSFITRWIQNEGIQIEQETTIEPSEDLETPAFIRKRLQG